LYGFDAEILRMLCFMKWSNIGREVVREDVLCLVGIEIKSVKLNELTILILEVIVLSCYISSILVTL